jgi:hypothetical protein
VLRAHYEGGRDNCGWEATHKRLFPNAGGSDSRRKWNKAVPLELRQLAGATGQKAGVQQLLYDRQRAMEDRVLRHEPEAIARELAELGAPTSGRK